MMLIIETQNYYFRIITLLLKLVKGFSKEKEKPFCFYLL